MVKKTTRRKKLWNNDGRNIDGLLKIGRKNWDIIV